VTLNLRPLYEDESKNVEEALIAHFGLDGEARNKTGAAGYIGSPGQLENLRHEIDRRRADYCIRLLAGQWILARSGYQNPYSRAYFTKDKSCPGVVGPLF
jgi:hypothetical protein